MNHPAPVDPDGPGRLGVAAIILAAGGSARLGRPKQLVPFAGEPLVRRAARCAREAGAAPVLVVLGAVAEECRAVLAASEPDARVVEHPGWAEGIGSTLAAGARFLQVEAPTAFGGCLVLLCDQPRVSAEGLRGLLNAWRAAPDGAVISTFGGGAQGPPAVFPRAWLGELSALRGDEGARVVLRRRAAEVHRYSFPAASMDLDTPEDLARALADEQEDISCNNRSDI